MDSQFLFILELVAAALTLMVLIYLVVGDNALFRAVSYSFVGVAAGYVLVVIIFQVLLPRFAAPLLSGNFVSIEFIFAVIALLLGGLMFFKLSPRLAFLGNVSMAVLVGVGAAVAIGGAIYGTLFGQTLGAARAFPNMLGPQPLPDKLADLISGAFVLVGTICTLAYFQFSAISRPGQQPQRNRLIEVLAAVGKVFIGITLGSVFAGVFAAAITAFIERIGFLNDVIVHIIEFFNG